MTAVAAVATLAAGLTAATGPDGDLDAQIANAFQAEVRDYSASVEACRSLVGSALPGWRLHVGFDATGLFPYASLSNNGQRVEASAPTLPLAMLRVAVAAWGQTTT
jgi:hypothetical protein